METNLPRISFALGWLPGRTVSSTSGPTSPAAEYGRSRRSRFSHRLMLLPANGKRLMLALQQAVNAHEVALRADRTAPARARPENPTAKLRRRLC